MDESYRPLLPLLRLRSEYPPWLLDLFVGLILFFFVASLVYPLIRRYLWKRHVRRAFTANALERGLSPERSQLLLRIARRDRMKHPFLLLSSLRAFDRHVGGYAGLRTDRDGPEDRELTEIDNIRRILTFDRAPPDQPLYTTRELAVGQTLMVFPVKKEFRGFCQCVVVHRNEHAITAAPRLREDDKRFGGLKSGDRLKVRFWREGDTEYRFRTEILDTVPQTIGILIRHAEKLERIQKRDFFRLEVGFDLCLFAVPAASEVEQGPEEGGVVEGRVVDISGGGFGFLSREPVPTGSVLEIDPDFRGLFPLTGLRCKVIEQSEHSRGYSLGLEFADLPPGREREIIHQIYELQVERASGR
ncbi:MAG: hypothetical protein HOC74_18030 [Gemmatimonadetes bacterium]|jgi:c-di-GMP-binding flagellar brake protein YcgR|nr:hypothetical protein [Gemmatimonadota bacterium]